MTKIILLSIIIIFLIILLVFKKQNKKNYKNELERFVKTLINNTNIIKIVDISTYDVEIAKNYSSYDDFIKSIFDDIGIALLNYIKNNTNIPYSIKKYANLDNIKDITDYILNEYDYYTILENIYNETKINMSKIDEIVEDETEDIEPIDSMVKELSDNSGEINLVHNINDIYIE